MQTRRQLPFPFGTPFAKLAAALAGVLPPPAQHAPASTPMGNGPPDPAGERDERIRAQLLVLLAGQPWWNADMSNVWVKDGAVIYQGLRSRLADPCAALALAERVPGVCAVRDRRVVQREWQSLG